jgi:hypothetical protein
VLEEGLEPQSRSVLEALTALGPPDAGKATDLWAISRPRQEDLLEAETRCFEVMGRKYRLVLPIDWTQDPIGSSTWRYEFHTLHFLAPLLRAWSDHGSRESLQAAFAIGLDWVRSNPRGGPRTDEFAWYDSGVGHRVGVLAYLLRAAAAADAVSEPEASEMLESLLAHGSFLADERNYTPDNHGLYQDEGLLLLCQRLPFLPRVAEWRALAWRRFITTLRRTVSRVDCVGLEHSPTYHFVLLRLVRRAASRPDPECGDELRRLAAGMEDAAAWFVGPDGTLPEVGDTDQVPAPPPTAEAAQAKSGLAAFLDAGYAAMRKRGSYLLVSGAYHSGTHKHADELSFVLFEKGVRIVGDSGRYGQYETEPGRRYARSSRAHNVLLVDGRDFTWRGQVPYGSGLRWAAGDSGWYAVEGVNPLLEPLDVRHRRLFLYRPAAALVIVDEVRSEMPRTYQRVLHFGATIELHRHGTGFELSAEGVRGYVSDWGTQPTESRIVRGQSEPELQGWTFPADRDWVKAATLELASEATDALYATVVSLTEEPATIRDVRVDNAGTSIELALPGSQFELDCLRAPDRLIVRERGCGSLR